MPTVDRDPRLASMDDEFRRLAAEIVRGFRAMSGARKKRVFHPTSTTVAGSLTVSPMPGAPRNAFFEPGRVLPLIIRFANGVQEDDAAWDNRGATLRVLSPEHLDRGLLDLLLTTGRTFSSRAARDFRAWMLGDRSAREAMVREHPRFGVAAWEMFRAIDSYTDVHYFTKVVQSYVDTEGAPFLTRFRLRDPRRPEDAGFLDAGSALLPPDRTSRAAGDERSRTFLHDDLRRRIGDEGIDLLLELQVRSVPADPAERDDAVDASGAWSEDTHPWHEAGRIRLNRVVANPQIESVAFNPVNAPRELAMLYARTADDPASLNHLRSIVYEVAAAARLGKEPAAALAPLLAPFPEIPSAPRPRARPLKVAVIGGGVSGLTAARELTALGAAVTVFERADEVGGKAASVEIGGHVFDLGAHLCSAAYEQLATLLEELGIERDDVSPVILYDIEANAPRNTFADVSAEFLRYHTQVRPHLGGILDPGFERHEARFSEPLATWAASEGIEELVAATGIGFTASGYGHTSNPELPALYFLKYAETATFCMDPSTLRYWTPRGGFGNVWKRVADELPDVRCGAEIEAVERDADGVRVRVGGVTHRFDRLVVAAPLHEIPSWLELSPEEAELFSKIRLLDYATVIVSAVGLPRDGFFLVKNHCEDPGSVGHTVSFHHRHPESDVYLLWAYLEDGMTDEELLGRLGEDAARMGGRVTTVHAVHRWRYFPHVAPAAMEAGFYRRAAAMQGRQHTFYAGSLFNFELVDCNMRHARAIARAVMQEETAALVESIEKSPEHEPATSIPLPASLEELRKKGEALVAQMQEFLQTLQDAMAIHVPSPPARPVSATEAVRSAPGSLRSRLDGCGSIEERGRVFVGYLQQLLAEQLNGELPEPHLGFVQLGLDSLLAVSLYERLHHDTGLRLPPTLFYEYTSIASLAEHLAEVYSRERPVARPANGASTQAPLAGNLPSRLDRCGSTEERGRVFIGYLQELLAEQLNGEVPEPHLGFVQLGLDSLLAVSLYERLHHDTGLRLPPTLFYEYTSIASLAEHLAEVYSRERPVARPANGASTQAPRAGNLRSRLDGCGSASARAGVFVGYLQQLLAEQLNGEVPEPHLGFVQLGLDSLLAVSLYERLHHDTGLRLPPTLFYEYTSIASLAEYLAGIYTRERPIARPAPPAAEATAGAMRAGAGVSPRNGSGTAGVRARMMTIVPAPGVATRRLLCFPHAGGDPSFFRRWEPTLAAAGTEVLALDLERPGDIQPNDLSAVLEEVRQAIGSATDLPYVVFGHSLGAMLAYEMVCRLQEEGARLPTHLFLSSFWAPHKAEVGLRTPHFLGQHSAMSPAAVQTWSTSTSATRLGIWAALLPSWKHVERQPLRVPLTVFQGHQDLMPPEDGVEAWSGYTATAFTSRILPGGHFHIADRNSPVPGTLRAALDDLVGPPVTRIPRDGVHLDSEKWLTRLREGLTRRPGAQTGAWHYYTLAHLARVSALEAPDRPLFPEALERLLAAEADGALLFAAHPVFDHIVALTAANTLLRWNGEAGRFASQIRRLLDRAMSARELSVSPEFGGQETPYGQAYKVIIILPHKVMLGSESSQILQRAVDLDERTTIGLQANARTQSRITSMLSLSPARIDAVFRGMYKNYEDSWVYFYGEHVLSDEAFGSEAARENARRNPGMPMLLAELCARFLEVTRDPLAETALRSLLPRLDDGLRPNIRLFEVASALNYLVRAGVDVARYLPETVQWFSGVLKSWGVGLGPDDPYMDTDTTAFAIYVDQALGLNRIRRGAAVFDSRWNEETQEYHHLTNVDIPEMFTTLSILEAYLRDPAISRERQRALWEHSINHLEQRVWIQGGFVSPLVLWDKIIQVFFTYEDRFPERTTRSHHRALDLVLSLQEPSGGFRSFYFNEANPQETAFGLYALKTALAARLPPAHREQVRGAAAAAERFLAQSWANTPPGFTRYQCQGIAKLTCNAPNAIEALIIGALLMPWPETERRS